LKAAGIAALSAALRRTSHPSGQLVPHTRPRIYPPGPASRSARL